jgi:hypothetical protein
MYLNNKAGNVYTISFATTSMSTSGPWDVFPFQAGSLTRVSVEEISIGIVSNSANNLAVQIYRGSTTPLSTGVSSITPVNLAGWTGAGAAGSSGTAPSSSLPSTTSASLLDARTFEDGFHYEYRGRGDMILAPSQRLDVVMTTPGSGTVYGTLKFREIGKNPV